MNVCYALDMVRKFVALIPIVVCAAVCLCAESTVAQRRRQPRRATPKTIQRTAKPVPEPEIKLEPRTADPDVDNADFSITANIRAKSLIFEAVPNPKVEFFGQPARNTVWEAKRENLPDQVQPGVTYRNIGIRLKITSVFRDIDRIVAEALGEVPVSDDTKISAPPKINTTTPAPAQTPTPPPPRER